MKVSYYRDSAAVREDDGKDAIEILILADHPVFHAACRGTGSGASLASKAAVLDGGSKADMVIIVLDRIYFEHRARLALGNAVPKLPEEYAAADAFVHEVGNALLSDFRANRLPRSTYLESLAGVLAVHLAAHHCDRYPAVPPSVGLPGHKLNRVLAFVAENIADPIRIRDLSGMVHMSLHHFARMFKQATGVPPHLYITLQRIERAKALLRDSELALVDVAASVGFQTQGHFTAVFHRYADVTPRAFRLSCRAAASEPERRARCPNRRIESWMRKGAEDRRAGPPDLCQSAALP
jgi:AraC family transcriptional regulator